MAPPNVCDITTHTGEDFNGRDFSLQDYAMKMECNILQVIKHWNGIILRSDFSLRIIKLKKFAEKNHTQTVQILLQLL